MSELWPIYIPSRGRAGKVRTFDLLPQATLVVEPHQWESYAEHYPPARIAVLPDDHQGIGYAREQIKRMANRARQSWFWMMDDDLTAMYRVAAGHCVKCDAATALLFTQASLALEANTAMVGFEYQQYAWRSRVAMKRNVPITGFVGIHAQRCAALHYRGTLKEDLDFQLQVRAAGLDIVKRFDIAFATPTMGKSEGGCHDEYGREAEQIARLCRRWPGIATPYSRPDGRWGIRVNWKVFP